MVTITNKRVYDFKEQFIRQQEYFDRFVDWIRELWVPDEIQVASREQERQGIDLIVRLNREEFRFEIKTDFMAARTENLCFETVSVASPGKRGVLGWGLKMDQATEIVYIVVGPDDIYWFHPQTLQKWVLNPDNHNVLRPFAVRNKDYVTLGVLMPISRIRHLCVVEGNLNSMTVKGGDQKL